MRAELPGNLNHNFNPNPNPNPNPHPHPNQAFGGGMSPGQKRRKAAEGEKGIPIGLVRVATLDGVRASEARTTLALALLPPPTAAVQRTAPPFLLTSPTPPSCSW